MDTRSGARPMDLVMSQVSRNIVMNRKCLTGDSDGRVCDHRYVGRGRQWMIGGGNVVKREEPNSLLAFACGGVVCA